MFYYIRLLYYIQFLTWPLFQSLCAQFATGNFPINQFYGSSSKVAAEKEIEEFFPPQATLALIKPHVTQEQRCKHLLYHHVLTFYLLLDLFYKKLFPLNFLIEILSFFNFTVILACVLFSVFLY